MLNRKMAFKKKFDVRIIPLPKGTSCVLNPLKVISEKFYITFKGYMDKLDIDINESLTYCIEEAINDLSISLKEDMKVILHCFQQVGVKINKYLNTEAIVIEVQKIGIIK